MVSKEQPSPRFLDSAPPCLINLIHQRQSFPGRKILIHLLIQSDMEYAWATLSKHLTTDSDWSKLWKEISLFCHQSNKVLNSKSREAENKDYDNVRTDATKLLESLNKTNLNDWLAYDFFQLQQ